MVGWVAGKAEIITNSAQLGLGLGLSLAKINTSLFCELRQEVGLSCPASKEPFDHVTCVIHFLPSLIL